MRGKKTIFKATCGSTGTETTRRKPGWANLTSPHRYDCCTMGSDTGQITCAFTRHKEKTCICAQGQRNGQSVEFQRKEPPSLLPMPVDVGHGKKINSCFLHI